MARVNLLTFRCFKGSSS